MGNWLGSPAGPFTSTNFHYFKTISFLLVRKHEMVHHLHKRQRHEQANQGDIN